MVVIARDPERRKRIAYLMTTEIAMSASAVVEMFARRWTIEQLFSVAKNQMGFDSAEVRKENSVKRHAALTLALITMTEVWAYRFRRTLRGKTFAAKLAAVREEAVKQAIFASGRISKRLAELFSTATAAA